MSATPPAAVGVAAAPTEASAPSDESIRVLLSISKSFALLIAILAGLLALLFLAFTILDVVLGRGAGAIVVAVYCLLSAAVNYLLWRELPRFQRLAADRMYRALRDQLLVWAILGVIFFLLVGALLLVVWVKAELHLAPPPS